MGSDMAACTRDMPQKGVPTEGTWMDGCMHGDTQEGVSEKRARNANRNEPSRGRSLLHGQDMGKAQDHRSNSEQWLAIGGGWWQY